MWRIIIGLGAVLPAIALGFRLAILESPRYTADVLKKGAKAAAQLNASEIGEDHSRQDHSDSGNVNPELSNNGPRVQLPTDGNLGISVQVEGNPVVLRGGEEDQIRQVQVDQQHETTLSNGHVVSPAREPRGDINRYYWDQGHGWTLFATSLCWFVVDLPFHGLGMNSTQTVGQIWADENPRDTTLYPLLSSNAWEALLFVSIGAVSGGLITFFSINLLGERNIQMIGFSSLFVLFILTGGLLQFLMNTGRSRLVVGLYLLCQIFFNFGEVQP